MIYRALVVVLVVAAPGPRRRRMRLARTVFNQLNKPYMFTMKGGEGGAGNPCCWGKMDDGGIADRTENVVCVCVCLAQLLHLR